MDLVVSCRQPRKPWRWQGHEKTYWKAAIDQSTGRGAGEGASERPHLEDRIGDVRMYGDWNSAAESYLARLAAPNIGSMRRELNRRDAIMDTSRLDHVGVQKTTVETFRFYKIKLLEAK